MKRRNFISGLAALPILGKFFEKRIKEPHVVPLCVEMEWVQCPQYCAWWSCEKCGAYLAEYDHVDHVCKPISEWEDPNYMGGPSSLL